MTYSVINGGQWSLKTLTRGILLHSTDNSRIYPSNERMPQESMVEFKLKKFVTGFVNFSNQICSFSSFNSEVMIKSAVSPALSSASLKKSAALIVQHVLIL